MGGNHGRSHSCLKKIIAARLKSAKENLDVPLRIWQIILWTDPKNIAELKQFCKDEWSNILPDRGAENVWLSLLLPKEGQPVMKSKGSHTFSTLHCECLHSVFNKDLKTYNCLFIIGLSRLCLSTVVT
jgi:hypothetical protein